MTLAIEVVISCIPRNGGWEGAQEDNCLRIFPPEPSRGDNVLCTTTQAFCFVGRFGEVCNLGKMACEYCLHLSRVNTKFPRNFCSRFVLHIALNLCAHITPIVCIGLGASSGHLDATE